ncbi:MAG: MnhB domain-containing protein [Acetobacteraceae bacterium]
MTFALVADVMIVVLLLGLAYWVNAATGAFVAVVGYVAFGLLLALAWMRLAAGDVALTEAAVGSGVTGAVLVAAAMRLRGTEVATRPTTAQRLTALAVVGPVTVGLAALVLWSTDPPPSLAGAAAAHLSVFGMENAVTSVLIGYRALDTLLEKIVLLLALAGVWSLTRDSVWGGRPWPHAQRPDNGAMVLFARLLPPIGIVVAVYILWVGATDPGGAFQGGAILTAMWLLVMMAGLRDVPAIDSRALRLCVTVGPAAFLVVGLTGFALPTGFLSYPASIAKPLIIAVEAVLTLSIAVILGLLVTGPAERPR